MNKKLQYGMIGGGQGGFIGEVHRKAIALDGMAELAAGCFSRSPENTLATGMALGLAPERCYKNFEEMAQAEAGRPDKIDFAVIVTPNNTHYAAAKACLNNGIHVVCDKPLTFEVAEAQELADLARKNKLLFCVTYTYTGYPAVKQVREMIRNGEIGDIRFINAEYPQEWMATPVEKTDHKGAQWRTDPAASGKTNCLGDIGSHVENMVSYMTGLKIKSLCARLDKLVEGRRLDDNASIMLEYDNGAKGLYWASQICIGYDNGLRVRIFGSKGSIQWAQESPNYIEVYKLGQPNERWSRGRDGFAPAAGQFSRIPAGHPEGYIEAFANIYKAFISSLAGETAMDFPNVEMGIDGVKFINKCAESSDKGAVWVNY